MFDKLAEYRKAIAAFATPGIIIIIASLTPASDGGSTITISEWLYVILAVLGTGTAVAAIPNALTATQKLAIAEAPVHLAGKSVTHPVSSKLRRRAGDAHKIANPHLYPVADVQAARARAGLGPV